METKWRNIKEKKMKITVRPSVYIYHTWATMRRAREADRLAYQQPRTLGNFVASHSRGFMSILQHVLLLKSTVFYLFRFRFCGVYLFYIEGTTPLFLPKPLTGRYPHQPTFANFLLLFFSLTQHFFCVKRNRNHGCEKGISEKSHFFLTVELDKWEEIAFLFHCPFWNCTHAQLCTAIEQSVYIINFPGGLPMEPDYPITQKEDPTVLYYYLDTKQFF